MAVDVHLRGQSRSRALSEMSANDPKRTFIEFDASFPPVVLGEPACLPTRERVNR
jgi:hypothetical protein